MFENHRKSLIQHWFYLYILNGQKFVVNAKKPVNFDELFKPKPFSQSVLPDWSFSIEQKLVKKVKKAKNQNIKCDILRDF